MLINIFPIYIRININIYVNILLMVKNKALFFLLHRKTFSEIILVEMTRPMFEFNIELSHRTRA